MEGHTQGHLKRNREDVLFRIPKTSYFRTRYREISMTVAHLSEIETKKTFILKEKRLDLLGRENMNYKIVICDDSDVDRQYLSAFVSGWAASVGHSVQIAMFASAEDFLFQYAEKSDYDILLLDIEMGSMDGVTMAKTLRKDNDTIQIIFITGYSDYISEGYEVAALHYLMKPVKQEKLFSVLDRAVEKLAKNEKVLNFEMSGEMVRIPIYQIRYAEVFGNYVTIHADDKLKIKMSLGELERELDDRFYRVGRSVIVNLTQISRVTKLEIKLNDGTAISLPRGAYDGVNRAIINMR